jgi:hypothetical protein
MKLLAVEEQNSVKQIIFTLLVKSTGEIVKILKNKAWLTFSFCSTSQITCIYGIFGSSSRHK